MTLFGKSVKTTILGYVIAALVAIQPLLIDPINWDSRHDVARYVFRLAVAVLIAVFGKMAADSAQVKEVKKQTDVNSMLIDTHMEKQAKND